MKQLIKSLFVLTVISMFFVTMMQLPAPVQATTTLDSKKTDLESAWFTAIPVYDSLWKPYISADIYASNFEESVFGDNYEWSNPITLNAGSATNVSVATLDPHTGDRHLLVTLDGENAFQQAYVYRNFVNQSIVYAQAWVQFKDLMPTNGTTFWVLGAYNKDTTTNPISAVTVKNESGSYIWVLNYLTGTSVGATRNLTLAVSLDTYYNVELYTNIGNGNGAASLYVNGVLVRSVSGITNNAYGDISQIRIGQLAGAAAINHRIFIDDVSISSNYIGASSITYAWSAEDNLFWEVGNNNFTTQSGFAPWVWAQGGGIAYLYAYAYKSIGHEGYSGNITLRDMAINWLDGYFFNKRSAALSALGTGYYVTFLPYQNIGFALKAADLLWNELNSTVKTKMGTVAEELGNYCQPNLDKGGLENVNQRMWTIGGSIYAVEVADKYSLMTSEARSNLVTMINNATLNTNYLNTTMEGGLGYTESGNIQGFYNLICLSNLAIASEYNYNTTGANNLLLESANYTKATLQCMEQFGWGGPAWQSRKFFDCPASPTMGAITSIKLAQITGDGEYTYLAQKNIDTIINLITTRGFDKVTWYGYNTTSFIDHWLNPYMGHLIDLLDSDVPGAISVPSERVYAITGLTEQVDLGIIITDNYVAVVGYVADKPNLTTEPQRRWSSFIDNPAYNMGELGSVVWLAGNTFLNNTFSFGWQYRGEGMTSQITSNAVLGNPSLITDENITIGADYIFDRKTITSKNTPTAPTLTVDTLITFDFTSQHLAINGNGSLFPWISTHIGSPSGTQFTMYGNESDTPQIYTVTNSATGTTNTTTALYHQTILSNSDFTMYLRRQDDSRPATSIGQRFINTAYNLPSTASGGSPDGYNPNSAVDYLEVFAGGDLYIPQYVENPTFDVLFVPEAFTSKALTWASLTQTGECTFEFGDETLTTTSQWSGNLNINQSYGEVWKNYLNTNDGLFVTSSALIVICINGVSVSEIYSIQGIPLTKITKIKGVP